MQKIRNLKLIQGLFRNLTEISLITEYHQEFWLIIRLLLDCRYKPCLYEKHRHWMSLTDDQQKLPNTFGMEYDCMSLKPEKVCDGYYSEATV